MSVDIVNRPARSVRQAADTAALLDNPNVAALLGTLLFAVMTLGQGLAVWRTGIFYGPDDAMRAVEVRDLLNGQGWFDLVPHRLSPDHPFVMHWSRLADLPLVVLMVPLRWILAGDVAERLTRLIEPVALFMLTMTILAHVARDLCGRPGPLAVVLLSLGALDTLGDFLPGRIHHHGLQILLLMLMVKLVCDGLVLPRSGGRMMGAGMVGALSLAINLQNMPFVAATAALVGFFWVLRGNRFADAIRGFGFGLAVSTVAVFLVDVPPERYLAGTCDALGAPHLLAAMVGGLGFVGLGTVFLPPASIALRTLALATVGALLLGVMYDTYPACLGDPYAGVDPLLRDGWMAEVGEAMPLMRLLTRDPFGTLPIVLALMLGSAAVAAAWLGARRTERSRWAVVAVLSLVAVAGTLWQVRVAASAEILLALGGAWIICRLFASAEAPRRFATLLAVMTGLAFTPMGWTAVAAIVRSPAAPQTASRESGLDPVDPVRCFTPENYESLARLPTGLVLSTIDPGAHILAYTHHSALAAPYHRDAYGIRLALQVFGAPPDVARTLIIDSRADYVALCTASPEVRDFVHASPDGFAARILANRLPAWLSPIDGSGPLRLYAVRHDAG